MREVRDAIYFILNVGSSLEVKLALKIVAFGDKIRDMRWVLA